MTKDDFSNTSWSMGSSKSYWKEKSTTIDFEKLVKNSSSHSVDWDGVIKLDEFGGTVQPVFPTPLYFNYLKRPFRNTETECFNDVLKNLKVNTGNHTSASSLVLDDERLSDLKKWFVNCLYDYFNIVLHVKDDITPYITSSWLNSTEKGQFHHEHYHTNSIVSAVFYIDANEETDNIVFHKQNINPISISVKNDEYNQYNAESYSVVAQTGMLILFPSSLRHSVPSVTSDETRVSLSFNTFVKGSLGDEGKNTLLVLD